MQVALGNHDFGRGQQGFSFSKKMPLETKHSLAAPLGLRQLGPSFFASQRLQAVRFGFRQESNNVFDLKDLKRQLVAVYDSPEERYKIAQPFLDALRENGYIRVKNHGIEQSTVTQAFNSTTEILGKSYKELEPFNTPEINQFRGMQLKPNDPKRVFTVGHTNNVFIKGHEDLTNNGVALFNAMQPAARDMMEVISLIYEGRPDGLLAQQIFGDTLGAKKPVAESASLRQLFYPNASQLKTDQDNLIITDTLPSKHGKQYVRLEPHLDYGYITVLPASKKEGLYVLPHSVAINNNVQTEADARNIPPIQVASAAGGCVRQRNG